MRFFQILHQVLYAAKYLKVAKETADKEVNILASLKSCSQVCLDTFIESSHLVFNHIYHLFFCFRLSLLLRFSMQSFTPSWSQSIYQVWKYLTVSSISLILLIFSSFCQVETFLKGFLPLTIISQKTNANFSSDKFFKVKNKNASSSRPLSLLVFRSGLPSLEEHHSPRHQAFQYCIFK